MSRNAESAATPTVAERPILLKNALESARLAAMLNPKAFDGEKRE
jgi:hypothetical protein